MAKGVKFGSKAGFVTSTLQKNRKKIKIIEKKFARIAEKV